MLIKSVELKNIKSYHYETIEFLPGVNGICGHNGHGKTTILEAIGYVLFDHLPYKKTADFLRYGEKSGYASVTLEAGDEIDYTIYRKIGGSDYYIKTPVSEIKGKKDVTDWIASNLLNNVRSPLDMPSIFENAVGVSQGTFTTAFLQNPEPRKKIFDNILRVEEYKAAYTNLRDVIVAIEKKIDSLERDLIPLHTRTEKYPELKKEKESTEVEIDTLKTEIREINIKIASLTERKEELSGKKTQLEALSSHIANERVRLEGLTEQLERANLDLQSAESAQRIVRELLPVEDLFKKKNLELKELNDARVKRDKLKENIAKLDSDIRNLSDKLERSSKLSLENNELEEKKKRLIPEIEAAHKLEEAIRVLQKELKDPMNDMVSRLMNLREKLKRMEDIGREIEEQRVRLSHLSPLKNKQLELEAKIKDLKDNLEIPLRELSSKISVLKEKEARAEKLRDDVRRLTNRRDQLMPAVERQKVLEDEINTLSTFLGLLSRLGFELRRAVEREQRSDILSSEIKQLENNVTALTPLIEQQTALETREKELSQQGAAVSSLLEQARSNMKLAGTQGLCPILNGVKCTSVSDFSLYFNNEIESRNKELKEIRTRSDLISKELKRLNNPTKQREDMMVLIEAKKKDISIYSGVHEEVILCRSKIEELVSSYPLLGFDILTGNEDEQKAVSLKLQSDKKELEKIQKSVSEFESIDALITSRNKDIEDLSDIPAALAECSEKIKELNSRFGPGIEIDNVRARLESAVLEIRSIDGSLKDMNDPVGQMATIESLISSKKRDLDALKEVPSMISACLKQLEGLNKRFNLKDTLDGSADELKMVEELIENKNRELKALNSPDKELEKLNEIIEKNLEELKMLEHVPESLGSCRRERDALILRSAVFEGLDEKINHLQDMIMQLEPEHSRYLQALPMSFRISEYSNECKKLKESIASINSALSEHVRKQEALLAEFNESLLDDTVSQLDELGKTSSSKSEAVKMKYRDTEKLAREIASMEKELLKIKHIEGILENEKKFLSFSSFIRDTIKNSSEYIVNEFIGEISQEASNIYSEIMDDHACGLRWQNDYDIEIESAGEVKSFKQLSGGERMSAALAVRLALLKALSNCDFVFLDEPTQNMDEIRREKLSQEIMKIRGFKQVFVISHDDTFNEKYAHVIRIQKIDGESRVVSCST